MTVWIAQTLLASSLLMLGVLSLRTVVAKQFGARAAYLLWCAPALRMLLPPLPESWVGFRPNAVTSLIAELPHAPALTLPTAHAALDWPQWACILWIAGALSFLVWHSLRYLHFTGTARATANWLYAENGVEVAVSAAIAAPVAFGFLNKTVLLPTDFENRYSTVEQRLSLAHEMAHHRRHDLPVNFGALLLLSLHWFNPLAHMAHRAFRLDQEAACDQQILAGASPEERQSYGIALFKSATASTPLVACATAEASTLKTRLRRIADGHQTQHGLWAVLPLAIAGTVATASIAQTAVTKRGPDSVSAPLPSTAPVTKVALIPATERTVTSAVQTARPVVPAASNPQPRKVATVTLTKTIDKPSEMDALETVRTDPAPSPTQFAAVNSLAAACQNAENQQVFSQDRGDHRLVIVSCDGTVGTFTNATSEAGLRAARADIEQMDLLSLEQRTSALLSVDRALSRLRPSL